MKRAVRLALVIGLMLGVAGPGTPRLEPARSPKETLDRLVEYARGHQQDPIGYVLKQFETHDLVFLGEGHYVKHDPEFVQRLIPALYAIGVRNLGIEFACHRDQELVDQLLQAPTYDLDLARRVAFRNYVLWGYKEYLDLYRAAWQLNRRLGPGKPPFRIVALMPQADWSQLTTSKDHLRDLSDLGEKLRVWPEGPGDTMMGRVILTELVAKHQKALVYMGRHHALTRYEESVPRLARLFLPPRAGRMVYGKIRDRACTIFLHGPWMQRNHQDFAPPVQGVIDAVFRRTPAYPTGFDTRGTPFGPLPDRNSYYAEGHEGFTLQDICDGYLFLKPLAQYEMVTVDEGFIHAGNLREAIAQLPDPEERKKCRSVADVQALIRAEAEAGFGAVLASR